MLDVTPLLVRTFGRTGSTLLMQLLGTSPSVLFEQQYPYEHRYLTYAYQMSRIAGLPYQASDDWDNNVLFQGQSNSISVLPYARTDLIDRQRLSTRMFRDLWRSFSAELRASANAGVIDRCYYAEKSPHKVADLATELLDARTIYLLRDPRDELVSIRSFNQKRGFHAFGWQEDDTDLSYARKMCRNRRVFMQDILTSESGTSRFHVRYEDLINNGRQEAARLSDWLGVTLDYTRAAKNRKVLELHATSRNPAASVQRWRRELSAEVQALFSEELGNELINLGYAV